LRFVGCIAFLIVSVVFSANAQLEYANWIWNDSNQLAFSQDTVVHETAPNHAGYSYLGKSHASISDRNGNLLFYAADDRLLDKNGDSIDNGYSWNGAALSISPIPCNDSLFIVFKSSGYTLNNPAAINVNYQIINTNGNGGLGEVFQPNTILDSTVNTPLDFSIKRHANNRDFWFVYRHKYDTNSAMYAWHISDTGIAANPVISLQEYFDDVLIFYSMNDFSPVGNYYAQSYQTTGQGSNNISITRLLTFNDATGEFQLVGTFNETNLSHPDANHSVAFSPDGTKLYCVSMFKAIWQFDLSSGVPSTMLNSGQDIASFSTNYPAGLLSLRLGIDGKIYVSRGGNNINATTYLGVINNPNDTGSACNFVLNGLQCNQHTQGVLPSIIHNLYVKRTI